MVIRQLKAHQYEQLHKFLVKRAHIGLLEASYTASMIINGKEYAVKIQPERHNKMAVLQVVRIERGEYGVKFELITKSNLLSSFLEILISQALVS
ncbi:hypothetical protein DFR58_12825 [Anaerobacterium chartisolvens]|uniref:Uncharacterized protein n=1 Tax=Anaerobacterium chartisolvens TaxID=1297424 RepID=A0A369AQL7_9FIRM|nr:hypothetical protein [Anaerobacterium chartisolvens]RCX10526.1 hypothetical protein DFR58_12825 [Anaerobacterium chartisolvens]